MQSRGEGKGEVQRCGPCVHSSVEELRALSSLHSRTTTVMGEGRTRTAGALLLAHSPHLKDQHITRLKPTLTAAKTEGRVKMAV